MDFNSGVNTLIVLSSLRTVLSSAFRPRSSYFTTEQSNKLFVPQRQFTRICSQEHGRMFPKASAIKFTIHIVDTHVRRKTASFHSSTSSSRGVLYISSIYYERLKESSYVKYFFQIRLRYKEFDLYKCLNLAGQYQLVNIVILSIVN